MGDDGLVPRVDWAAVQFDYEQRHGSLKDICARYGVSEAQLRHRRERHGWQPRNDWKLRVGPLLARMMRVLDGQVRALENDMNQPVDKTANLLGTMTKTLEKILALEAEQQAKPPARSRELSDLRNKLAARIEQLKRRD